MDVPRGLLGCDTHRFSGRAEFFRLRRSLVACRPSWPEFTPFVYSPCILAGTLAFVGLRSLRGRAFGTPYWTPMWGNGVSIV